MHDNMSENMYINAGYMGCGFFIYVPVYLLLLSKKNLRKDHPLTNTSL